MGICNTVEPSREPPYKGSQWQTDEQKADLEVVFGGRTRTWRSLDYVAGWCLKAADYSEHTKSATAFVATNSICQGRQVGTLWPLIFGKGQKMAFAHTSFKWANLASYNAGVTVVIVGLSAAPGSTRFLYTEDEDGATQRAVDNINAYLVPDPNVVISQRTRPISELADMSFGNMPNDGGHLLLYTETADQALKGLGVPRQFVRNFVGSREFI